MDTQNIIMNSLVGHVTLEVITIYIYVCIRTHIDEPCHTYVRIESHVHVTTGESHDS